MRRFLPFLLVALTSCADDATVKPADEPVAPSAEFARTAVNSANEASLYVGKLDWGKDPATGKTWTVEALRGLVVKGKGPVARDVRATLRKADALLRRPPRSRSVDHLFLYAFCARVAIVTTQASCKTEFRSGLFGTEDVPGWVRRDVPSAYPVERSQALVTLFRAVDLFLPLMTIDEKAEARAWLHRFAEQEDEHGLAAWQLSSKLTASVLLEDERLTRRVQDQIRKRIVRDLLPPEGWKPDRSCRNHRDEQLFGSQDFRRYDALQFHVHSLEAWLGVVAAKPDALDATGHSAVARALDFLKPYYTGKKVHREFACTTVAADRGKAKTWRRDAARPVLKIAAPHYPGITSWAKPASAGSYAPALELVATLQAAR